MTRDSFQAPWRLKLPCSACLSEGHFCELNKKKNPFSVSPCCELKMKNDRLFCILSLLLKSLYKQNFTIEHHFTVKLSVPGNVKH